MKCLLVLLAVVACVSADDEWKPKTPEEMKNIRAACLAEHPLTEDQLSHMRNIEFLNEEAVRKYLVCTALKLGVLCTHEGYHTDRIAKQFNTGMDESVVKKVADDCVSKHPMANKDFDVYVYEVHTCVMDSEIGQRVKTLVKKHHD